jgi:hypothetical protein
MAWIPFVKRTDQNSCKTCNGYGGILDDETMDGEGLPWTQLCPECREDYYSPEYYGPLQYKDNLMTEEQLERADNWRRKHKDHVDLLLKEEPRGLPHAPCEEDINNPELWKSASWRWFMNNYIL